MPWDIERLTDWQIEKLIIEPAVKKSQEANPNGPLKMPSERDLAGTDRPLPTEDEFVAMSMSNFGGTDAGWRDSYRKAMAEDAKNASGS